MVESFYKEVLDNVAVAAFEGDIKDVVHEVLCVNNNT